MSTTSLTMGSFDVSFQPIVIVGFTNVLFNVTGLLLFIGLSIARHRVCKAQLPPVTIVIHSMMFMLVGILVLPFGHDFGNTALCWIKNWQSYFLHAILIGYNLKSFILYYKLKVATFQARVWTEHASPNNMLPKGGSGGMLGGSSDMKLLGSVVDFQYHDSFTIKSGSIALFTIFMLVPSALLCLMESAFAYLLNDCKAQYWLYSQAFLFSVDLLFQTWVSYKLRYLDDAFGIRFEIKWVTISALLGLCVFITAIVLARVKVQNRLKNMHLWGILGVTFVTTALGLWRPVIVSIKDLRKQRKLRRNMNIEGAQKEFVELLRQDEMFEVFKSYLITEFAVENLCMFFLYF
jgi:hypothetical protein